MIMMTITKMKIGIKKYSRVSINVKSGIVMRAVHF